MERGQVPGPGQDGERGEHGGFADGGPADMLAPGPELTGLLAAVTAESGAALAAMGEEEVLGVVAAGGRMAAWAAWVQVLGLAEFARRRPAAQLGSRAAREAGEEAGWKAGETWSRMLDQIGHALTLAERLPRTLEAMGRGLLSEYKAKIIEAQTAELSAADVAKADVLLAAAGQVKNPAGLRDFARRQVARLDPAAAVRKKERARGDAYVRCWQEDSGNAGLSARELPAAEAVLAWANIERRALDLRAAGVAGTAGQLQVQAVLDFLLGRVVPGQGACSDTHLDADEGGAYSGAHPGAGAGPYPDGSACSGAQPGGRGGGRGWVLNPVLLVPWDPSVGGPSGPAELPGFGLLDRDDTLGLLAVAGHDPAARWCLTVRGQDGSAVAHGCAPGRRSLADVTGAGSAAGLAARLGVSLTPIAAGACEHAHAEPGYTPSRKLRHLVQARTAWCAAPGCVRPAAACDLDHTVAWEDSHLTCECNLAPRCQP